MKKKRLLAASRDPNFHENQDYKTMPVTEEEEEAWEYLEKHQPKEEHNESERRHSKH
jgi:hypothetical protein